VYCTYITNIEYNHCTTVAFNGKFLFALGTIAVAVHDKAHCHVNNMPTHHHHPQCPSPPSSLLPTLLPPSPPPLHQHPLPPLPCPSMHQHKPQMTANDHFGCNVGPNDGNHCMGHKFLFCSVIVFIN
jgi:hypothetical protein